jgi:hypothetical protein
MPTRAALTTLLFLLPPQLLIGQITSTDRSVTVTASRNSTVVAADLALFDVTVRSPTDSSRDEVLAVVQGSGLNVTNFFSVLSNSEHGADNSRQDVLDWSFNLTAPLANLKPTLSQLTALQQSVAAKKNGMSVSFSIRGTQASPQAQAGPACATADLMAVARAEAQKMANAAGVGLGGVLSMSGASVVTPSGEFFSGPSSYPLCFLTVKFALTGF